MKAQISVQPVQATTTELAREATERRHAHLVWIDLCPPRMWSSHVQVDLMGPIRNREGSFCVVPIDERTVEASSLMSDVTLQREKYTKMVVPPCGRHFATLGCTFFYLHLSMAAQR